MAHLSNYSYYSDEIRPIYPENLVEYMLFKKIIKNFSALIFRLNIIVSSRRTILLLFFFWILDLFLYVKIQSSQIVAPPYYWES